MKCKKYECSNEASGRFPACSMTHGVKYKSDIDQVKSYKNGGWSLSGYYNMKHWSLNKFIYYSQLVK